MTTPPKGSEAAADGVRATPERNGRVRFGHDHTRPCAACGIDCAATAEYCTDCGSSLPKIRYCPQCGGRIQVDLHADLDGQQERTPRDAVDLAAAIEALSKFLQFVTGWVQNLQQWISLIAAPSDLEPMQQRFNALVSEFQAREGYSREVVDETRADLFSMSDQLSSAAETSGSVFRLRQAIDSTLTALDQWIAIDDALNAGYLTEDLLDERLRLAVARWPHRETPRFVEPLLESARASVGSDAR